MTTTYTDVVDKLHEPLAELLPRLGIDYKTKSAPGGGQFFNLSYCPLCGHRQEKPSNYQCGIFEVKGQDNGMFVHQPVCQHPHDTKDGNPQSPYIDWLLAMGEVSAEEYAIYMTGRIKNESRQPGRHRASKAIPVPAKPGLAAPRTRDKKPLQPLNFESNDAAWRRLKNNEAAVRWLTDPDGPRGLTLDTLRHFRCGLSKYYQPKDQADVWLVPLRGADGRFYARYMSYNIPNVTLNPDDENGWCFGPVSMHYSDAADGRSILLLVEGAKDLMKTWQQIQGDEIANSLLLATGTHGTGIPDEIRDRQFWEHWDDVIIAFDNDEAGDKFAEEVRKLAFRDVRRLRVPLAYGKPDESGERHKADLTDFWLRGGTVEIFKSLLDSAKVLSDQIRTDPPAANPQLGEYAYQPLVGIHCAFNKGHLYYAASRFVVTEDDVVEKDGSTYKDRLMGEQTIIIRSDGHLISATIPRSKGRTKNLRPIVWLSDGTILTRMPQASTRNSWAWPSIAKFLDGTARVRSLRMIIRDVVLFLRSRVYLRHESDYYLLALGVVISYCQFIFESVPHFFMLGPPGTGKSQTGIAMADIGCNGFVVGQQSAASLARLIDESRGLVALDDLEELGKKGKQFDELAQAIKLSYNKRTGNKQWYDMKTGRNDELVFFGVKVIGNTSGVDAILASRMIRIFTSEMGKAAEAEFAQRPRLTEEQLFNLRQELHLWTFRNVSSIGETYGRLFAAKTDRNAEISAPLRVIAELAADQNISAQLADGLTRQSKIGKDPEAPEEVFEEVLRDYIRNGYTWVSYPHLGLLMRLKMTDNYGKDFSNQIAEWERQDWMRRRLGERVDMSAFKRQRPFGSNEPNLRFYPLDPAFVAEVLKDHDLPVPRREKTDWCVGCDPCPLRSVKCGWETMRREWEKTPRAIKIVVQQKKRVLEAEAPLQAERLRRAEQAEKAANSAARYAAMKNGDIAMEDMGEEESDES